MTEGRERGTIDFAALLGDWKYKKPEPSVLQEYANGTVKVLSSDETENGHTSTVITTEFGTVTVYRNTGLMSSKSPYLGVSLSSDPPRLLMVANASPQLGVYTLHDSDGFVGTASGPRIDLGLAQALGIEDEEMQRDAKGSLIDPQVATRIISTFVFDSIQPRYGVLTHMNRV